MAVRGLYLLPGGTLYIEQSVMTYRTGVGVIHESPVVTALIETDEGYALVDTGVDPDFLKDPEGVLGAKARTVARFTAEDDIRSRLRGLGLSPQDIRWVICTHLHWDHTGGHRFFPQAEFIVQKAEYRFALYPDSFVANVYIRQHFDHPLNYRLIEGEMELVRGLGLIHTPGHTPGHMSVVIRLPESGTFIWAADAMYMDLNVEQDIPIGNAWSLPHAAQSMARLKHLAEWEQGRLLISHDPAFWEKYRPAPHCYR